MYRYDNIVVWAHAKSTCGNSTRLIGTDFFDRFQCFLVHPNVNTYINGNNIVSDDNTEYNIM